MSTARFFFRKNTYPKTHFALKSKTLFLRRFGLNANLYEGQCKIVYGLGGHWSAINPDLGKQCTRIARIVI